MLQLIELFTIQHFITQIVTVWRIASNSAIATI
jgi:hypothetical protein